MESQGGATVYYRIIVGNHDVQFTPVEQNEIYNNRGPGFIRKAIFSRVQRSQIVGKFIDQQFQAYSHPPQYRLVRLFDYYKQTRDLFPLYETESSYIQPRQYYNSFMGESGVVSYNYLRTLFLTQKVNQNGHYQYFVKRSGEYYLQQCDDLIPVNKLTWKPIWGLDFTHPWQIMLFKAWLKQCRSFQDMQQMEPFRFLDAFGLPQYRVFNFRKQLKFIRTQRTTDQNKKREKQDQFPMNSKELLIIGRTVDSKAVYNVGLVPNSASYRMRKHDSVNGAYILYSSLPCYWVGSHSAVTQQTPLNKIYNKDFNLDLERNVLINQSELLTYFNKFYLAPNLMCDPFLYKSQDCINLFSNGQTPVWLRFNANQAGMLSISIQLPKKRIKGKYPQFRYFLSKRNDEYEQSRSHVRQDIAGSRMEQNQYIESSCDKWDYYRIDYVQGYENHAATFSKINPGEYVLFTHVQENGPFRVRFDSQISITKPLQYNPSREQTKEIFDSTFYGISLDNSVEATFNQKTFQESIALNNSFQQLGFGSICIKTLQKARHKVAMRLYPDKLEAAGLRLLTHYDYPISEDQNKKKNIVLVSQSGRPEIVVLERNRDRSRNSIGQIFPPQGTVQFFKVIPNGVGVSTIPTGKVVASNIRPF